MRYSIAGLILLTSIFFGACKSPTQLRRSELSDKTPEFLIEEQRKTNPEFNGLSARISAQADTPERSISFKMNIRLQRDSIMWISISPALGIEVVRALITTDSVFVINRVDKTFLETDFHYLSEMANTDVDFAMLQALLTGTALEVFDPAEFQILPDREGYLISRLRRRKMKRVQNIFERIERLESRDKQERITKIEERKIDRIVDKEGGTVTDSSQFVAQSVWLRPEDYRIMRYRFRDFAPDRLLDIDYDDFKPVGTFSFPHSVKVQTTGEQPMKLSLVYSRITLDEDLSFPFSIPESYRRLALD